MEPLGTTVFFLLVCIVCLLVCPVWRKLSETGKLPPGPFPLPLIGNMLQLKNDLPELLCGNSQMSWHPSMQPTRGHKQIENTEKRGTTSRVCGNPGVQASVPAVLRGSSDMDSSSRALRTLVHTP